MLHVQIEKLKVGEKAEGHCSVEKIIKAPVE
jgi:hypothetical protein